MRRLALVATLLMLGGCGAESSQKQAPSSPTTLKAAPTDAFSVMRVDDSADPLANVPADQPPPGTGMAIFSENTMISGGKIVQTHFVRTVARQDEAPKDTCERFLGWVQNAHIALPSGDSWGCQIVLEYDSETKKANPVGVRSYVLTGAPALTQRDVTDAYIGDDKSDEQDFLDVAVKLSPEGRAKLRTVTGEWIHRRLAVLADGMVSMAPLVKGQIDSDTLTIAFGERSPAELDKAQAFVSRLLGK